MSLVTRLIAFSFSVCSVVVQAADIPASGLAGNFAVSPMGAATYSIPLSLPVGVNGATPKLSLNYSSQAGMGIAGMGWNIGGLSAITRCPQSKAVDGVQKALTLTADDRFCMDGQRLILMSGTYGAVGSTYQTEINNFARVTVLTHPSNSSLIYFKVETKDGKVLDYGYGIDAVLQPNAVGKDNFPLAWMLSKENSKYQKGQLITYQYTNDRENGQLTLNSVKYAYDFNEANNLVEAVFIYDTYGVPSFISNLNAGVNAQYEVESDYPLNGIEQYVFGSRVKKDKILNAISIRSAQSPNLEMKEQLNYKLKYNISPNTRRQRLEELRLCTSPEVCVPPLKFLSQDATLAPSFNVASSISGQYPAQAVWNNAEVYPRYIVDINSDAYPDIISSAYDGFEHYTNLKDFGFSSYSSVYGSFDGKIYLNPSVGYDSWSWRYPDVYPRYVADINNDGFPDWIGFGLDYVYVNINNRNNGFSAEQIALGGSFVSRSGWSGNNRPRFVIDVDADGYPDIVGFANDGVYVSFNNRNNAFGEPQNKLSEFGTDQGWVNNKVHPRLIADVDGDGYPDIVGFKDDGVYVSKNNGSGGFIAPERKLEDFGVSQGWTDNTIFPKYLLDVNSDGYLDIVGFSQDGLEVSTNDGAGSFKQRKHMISEFGKNQRWTDSATTPRQFSDINNDGLPDVVGFYSFKNLNNNMTYDYRCYLTIAINRGDKFTLINDRNDPILPSAGSVAGCDTAPVLEDRTNAIKYPKYVMDVNADGFLDFVTVSPEGIFASTNKNSGNVDRIVKIDNGLVSYNIEYSPLTKNNLYVKGSNSYYPDIDIISPMYVVKNVNASNGVNGVNNVDYKYQGLVRNVYRASQAFKTIATINREEKTRTDTIYNQSFPYVGLIASQRTSYCATSACLTVNTTYPFVAQDGFNVLSELTNSIENKAVGGFTANQKIYFPYVKSSTTKTFEPPVVSQ